MSEKVLTSKTESYIVIVGGDGYGTAIVHGREEMERAFVRAMWPDADFSKLDEEQLQVLAVVQDQDNWEIDGLLGRKKFIESYEDGWIEILRHTGNLFGPQVETSAPAYPIRSHADALEVIRNLPLHPADDARNAAGLEKAKRIAVDALLAAETPAEPQPIPVTEIIVALEREAQTETSPQWLAAQHLRRMAGWDARTLMCAIDRRPSVVQSAVKAPRDETGSHGNG